MSLLVKICGLKTPEAVDASVEAGADFTGFVFFEPSPRNLTPEEAATLMARVPDRVTKVALVVDPSDDHLEAIVRGSRPDLMQFHGSETPERLALVKLRYGIPVMKALPVSEPGDIAKSEAYAGIASWLLFDAKPPKDATRPGGNAQPFDWQLLKNRRVSLPWLLAGGITLDNLSDAVAISGAKGIDVSSAVESRTGEKDVDLIRRFVAAAKAL
ncbi:MAG: phosphoribosylanthranilate isomerase [Magnetovibrionaceae bacterium]